MARLSLAIPSPGGGGLDPSVAKFVPYNILQQFIPANWHCSAFYEFLKIGISGRVL